MTGFSKWTHQPWPTHQQFCNPESPKPTPSPAQMCHPLAGPAPASASCHSCWASRRGEACVGKHTEERGVCRKARVQSKHRGTGNTWEKKGQLLWVPPWNLSGLPYWCTPSSLEEVIRCTHGLHTPHHPVTKLWAETKTSTIPEPSEKAISQPIG